MKGISPLVATVFLVALVIAIGGLVSLFATNLVTTSTGTVSNQSQSQTQCSGAWININSVKSTLIVYSNPTTQTITNLSLTGDGMTGSSLSLLGSLSPGSTAANSTGFNVGTNTTFIIRGLCQSIIPIEGTCKQGQGCWNV